MMLIQGINSSTSLLKEMKRITASMHITNIQKERR